MLFLHPFNLAPCSLLITQAQAATGDWIASVAWGFWLLAAVLGLVAFRLLYVGMLRDNPKGKRRCGKCWYDMTGVPGLTCPECGRRHEAEQALQRRRRRRPITAAAISLLLLAFAVSWTPRIAERGIVGSVPGVIIAAAAVIGDTSDAALLNELSNRIPWRGTSSGNFDALTRWLVKIPVSRRLRNFDTTALLRTVELGGQSPMCSLDSTPRGLGPSLKIASWLAERSKEPPNLLATGLENPDPQTRLFILSCLSFNIRLTPDIADRVVAELASEHPENRDAAFLVVEQISWAFAHQTDMVSRFLLAHDLPLNVLLKLGDPGTAKLLALIDHPTRDFDALMELSTASSVPPGTVERLAAHAKSAITPTRRKWSIYAASKLAPAHPTVAQAAIELAQSDPDADVRHSALTSFTQSSVTRSRLTTELVRALTDPADHVRSFAAWQLGELGTFAASALNALDAVSNDPVPRVADAAIKSARQIRSAVADSSPTPPTSSK